MGRVFERKLVVFGVVVRVCLVVHHQKLPKRNILHHLAVLLKVVDQYRHAQDFVQLCVRVDVQNKQ